MSRKIHLSVNAPTMTGDQPPVKQKPDKRFVAWDTEGISKTPGLAQSCVLLGNNETGHIWADELRTEQMLEFMIDAAKRLGSDVIHVGYAFRYDMNQILCDLPEHCLKQLVSTNRTRFKRWRIEYIPNKWLVVQNGGKRIKIYDVIGYFQRAFVKTVEDYLGTDSPHYQIIAEGKALRQQFTHRDRELIVRYWTAEQAALVEVMNQLRQDFHDAGVFPTSWHGPAASASAYFKSIGLAEHMAVMPDHIHKLSKLAYAGGRFEMFKAGYHHGKVYEYDLNSAYPAAMANLPSLAGGTWEHVTTFEPGTFGLWHCVAAGNEWNNVKMYPLFVRDKRGILSWPSACDGWYWTPEAELINFPEENLIREGWVFRPVTDVKPFADIPARYAERQRLKAEGKSAERALKLILNSVYGKTAQRVGWDPETGRPPTWHQLEWAGYITSYTRASMFLAMQQNPDAIIACETDAIFSTEPLNLPISKKLGDWSIDAFEEILYLQSGFYFAKNADGTSVDKMRGFDRGSVSINDALSAIRRDTFRRTCLREKRTVRNPVLSGKQTRYIGAGLALQIKRLPWRAWLDMPHDVEIGGGIKRRHWLCKQCREGATLDQCLHECRIPPHRPGDWHVSRPHYLPWDVPEPSVGPVERLPLSVPDWLPWDDPRPTAEAQDFIGAQGDVLRNMADVLSSWE
jgi:hypothetical protein